MISEEEPIYCEIPSPCKGPSIPSSGVVKPSQAAPASSALQLQRGQPLRSSNSRLIPAPIQPQYGLGRRAITQLDISPPKRPPLIIQNSSRHADKTALNKVPNSLLLSSLFLPNH